MSYVQAGVARAGSLFSVTSNATRAQSPLGIAFLESPKDCTLSTQGPPWLLSIANLT